MDVIKKEYAINYGVTVQVQLVDVGHLNANIIEK